jgi:small-conductance mechanosensitive channel
MRSRGKIPRSSGSIGERSGSAIAILLGVLIVALLGAIAAISGSRALAQSPEPSASATSTTFTPQSTSNSAASSVGSPAAIVGAPSPLATSSLSRTPSAQPTPISAANAEASKQAAVSPTDPQTVIAYLSDVINWYRHLGVEAQLVVEPNETLYFAADRQVANDILNLAFGYARTQAKFIAQGTGQTAVKPPEKPAGATANAALNRALGPANPSAPAGNLGQRLEQLQATAADLQARLKGLQTRLRNSPTRQRAAISAEIATTQSELDLINARIEALNAILQFQTGSASPQQDLAGEIDQLEHSVSDAERNVKPATATRSVVEPSGILSLTSDLIELERRMDALEHTEELTKGLAARVTQLRDRFVKRISALDARGYQLAANGGAADVATLRERKQAFEALLAEHKIASASALPLSKQLVLLEIYSNNLERWRAAINDRWTSEFRSLCIRLIGLAGSFGLIFLGGLIWRFLTDRYVQDIRRRGQVLAARRLVIALLILIVLLLNFSDEIGSAATVVGFAAAGIAVALQNVILSVAGYFFLIGKFGIKAGDRVQLGGVTGDVIDIGLVKLSMMELGGDGAHRQPTGRVVVFSNSIVFQPAGNYFKQAPGTSFVWNEIRLTLAPDADYRLAEKRLLDAVDEVFTRYRDRVSAEFRRLERDLNIVLETPKPQSRLFLSHAGLEISIRYPADARSAAQIADEVSRRVLDAISREPSLRLATQGIANIQAQEAPPVTAADGHPSADQTDNGQAGAPDDDKTADQKKASGPAPTEK